VLTATWLVDFFTRIRCRLVLKQSRTTILVPLWEKERQEKTNPVVSNAGLRHFGFFFQHDGNAVPNRVKSPTRTTLELTRRGFGQAAFAHRTSEDVEQLLADHGHNLHCQGRESRHVGNLEIGLGLARRTTGGPDASAPIDPDTLQA